MGYKTITFNANNASDTINVYHNRPHFTSTLSYSYNSSNNKITFTVKFGSEFTDSWGYFHYKMGFRAVTSKTSSAGYISTSSVDLFGPGQAHDGDKSSLSALTTTVSVPENGILYLQMYCDGCKDEKNDPNFMGLNTGAGLYKFVYENDEASLNKFTLQSATTTSLTYAVTLDAEPTSTQNIHLKLYEHDDSGWNEIRDKKITSKTLTHEFKNLFPETKYKAKIVDDSTILDTRKDKTKEDFILKSISYRSSVTNIWINFKIDIKYTDYIIFKYRYKKHSSGSWGSTSEITYNPTTDNNIFSKELKFSSLEPNTEYDIELDFIGYSKETYVDDNGVTQHRIEYTINEGREKYINDSTKPYKNASGKIEYPPVKTKILLIDSIKLSSNAIDYTLKCASLDAYNNSISNNLYIYSVVVSENNINIPNINNRGSFTISDIQSYLALTPSGSIYQSNNNNGSYCTHNIRYVNLNRSWENFYIYAIIVNTSSGAVFSNNTSNDSLIRIGPIKLDSLAIDNISPSQINKYTHSIKISNIKANLSHNSINIDYYYPSYSSSKYGTFAINNQYTNNLLSNILQDPLTNENYIFTTNDTDDITKNIIEPIVYNYSDIYHRTESVKDSSGEYYSNNSIIIGKCGYTKESLTKNSNDKITNANILSTKLPYVYCLYDIHIRIKDNGGNKAIKTVRSNTSFPYTKIYTKLDDESSPSWHDAIPHIYSDGKWRKAIGKVYDGTDWQEQGSGNQAE